MTQDVISKMEEDLVVNPIEHYLWCLGNALMLQAFLNPDPIEAKVHFIRATWYFESALKEKPLNELYRCLLQIAAKVPEQLARTLEASSNTKAPEQSPRTTANSSSTKIVDTDAVKKLSYMISGRPFDHLTMKLTHCPSVVHFFITGECIEWLLKDDEWLDIAHLQVWCTYIHHLCIDNNNSDVYGFMDPGVLNSSASFPRAAAGREREYIEEKLSTVQEYIEKKLRDENKVCYLAPYCFNKHFQLIIICPKDNIVVVLCSLHTDLNLPMKDIVTNAFVHHQRANGISEDPIWLYPKTRRQDNAIHCGFYVMKNMIDIALNNTTKSWMKVFNDPKTLSSDELHDMRIRWASYFLELCEVLV